MMDKSKILAIMASLFVIAGTAGAAEFVLPSKDGDANLTISASETHANLYTAGANVTVNGRSLGDLFVAGGMVSVIGDVEQDLNMAGGSLSLAGNVGGDARIAGGNVTISSPVVGDLLVAGGNLSLTEKAAVGGDAVIAGGNIAINAPIRGKLRVVAGNLTINSRIEGDVTIFAGGSGRNNGKVVFGPHAEVPGKIVHKGPRQAIVQDGAKVSAIEYTQSTGRSRGRTLVGILTIGFLIKLLAWFLAGWLLVTFRKNSLAMLANSIRQNPWANLSAGFAVLILLPVAVLLLLFTLVGYYLAGLLLLVYLLALTLAGLISALVLGAWIVKHARKTENFIFDWKSVALGVVALSVIGVVPLAGWLFVFILLLMVLGAMFKTAKQKWSEGD